MLKSLRVKNYILIRELELNPEADLVVITGETGAGKSIILGAIDLLLGQRADTKTLFDAEKKCIIEGVFDISQYHLRHLFEENEWDYFDECIIRREINPAGRSRAFVNDSPANLNALKGLGEKLLDIHSQHESILVNNASYQLDIIDAYASNSELLIDYQSTYQKYRGLKAEYDELIEKKENKEKEEDYKSFLLKELEEADLISGEKEEIEKELQIAENAENILTQLSFFQQVMDLSEPNAMQMFKEAIGSIQKISSIAPKYEELFKRIESVKIELDDILNESQSLQEEIDMDAARLNELRERINLIQRLEAKHHVSDFEELLNIREQLNEDLQHSLNLESKIEEISSELSKAETKIQKKAHQLSETRHAVKDDFSGKIVDLLRQLGIEEASVEVKISEKPPGDKGKDQVSIHFSANKGQPALPLKDAASGGEMSRMMLCIKYLVADKTDLPTIIFDEIDTGISGKVAIQMGEMFKKIAREHQVMAITHLPQIAAKGKMQYVVYKKSGEDKTSTEIRRLSGDERIMEIAQMISGKTDSSSAIASAKELLEHN